MPMSRDELKFFERMGAQGGRKRAANMTKTERSESARKAVLARWKKAKVRSAKVKAKGESKVKLPISGKR